MANQTHPHTLHRYSPNQKTILQVERLDLGLAYACSFAVIGVVTGRWSSLTENAIFLSLMTTFPAFSNIFTISISGVINRFVSSTELAAIHEGKSEAHRKPPGKIPYLVLKFDATDTGFLGSLDYVGIIPFKLASGYASDKYQ
ncbi:hypothetical protein M3Y99_01006800 [Aphelenchoides fujianensis]|nr:hypothetical protein M3Y99_01006800 [Aphelenchoides fujianensis]